MKYLLLIYNDESLLTQSVTADCYKKSTAVADDLAKAGQLLGVAPLQPSATAKTVRYKDGKRMITSGPFAETHEQLGGYFLVDVPTMEEALEIAVKLPGGQYGSVEVRQLIELPGL